jgi:glycosyltransferase involved in cell wall biosynthesis
MLFTSLWEGLPTTLINLAQSGLPIVASDVGGISELIDSETGWLIHGHENAADYTNAIKEIWANPMLAQQKSEKLMEKIGARHSWQHYMSVVTQRSNFLGG